VATDGELLRRYAESGDESAFAELLGRHGPMVRAACERLAGPDAEDAAQAVFILLARKARKLTGWRDVALWLHGVCRHVARTARRERGRRRSREKEAAAMQKAQSGVEVSESQRREVRERLDEAVGALPERFREVVLLCHLEGASQQDVAERLGLPAGTVASRAKRGLERLRRRLARGSAPLGAAALAGLLAEGAAGATRTFDAAALLSSVVAASKGAAAGAAPAIPASILAKGAMQAMFWTKVKMAAAVLSAITCAGAAVPLTVAAVHGAEKPGDERVLGGEPPPQPVPQPGGAKVMIFSSEERSTTGGKADKNQLARAAMGADLVVVVKVTRIENAKAGEKKDPVAAGGIRVVGPAGGEDKLITAEAVEVLRGSEKDKKLKILATVRGEGKNARAVFRREDRLAGPNGNVQQTFVRSFSVPFTLSAGEKALVFLKLEEEQKDDAGEVTGRVYRLLPPLPGGKLEKTLAELRAALKQLAEWETAPKLSKEMAALLDDLVAKLGSDEFATREKATKDLMAKGGIVRGKVREALKSSDAETVQRAKQVLEAVKPDWLKKAKDSTSTVQTPNGQVIIQGGGAGRVRIQMRVGQ
jgi:RNA polymerase sigma factor (sigma-70 family)